MVKNERTLFETEDPSLLDTRILCPETKLEMSLIPYKSLILLQKKFLNFATGAKFCTKKKEADLY
jgi:hypothetical protein